MTALIAGAAYFIIVFAVGFLLGTMRILILAPAIGETGAVLTEVPFILGASWIVCGFVIRRFNVAPTTRGRLIMGVSAFTLLIGAETLLGIIGFGRTLDEVIAQNTTTAGAIGMAGQLLFAAFPLLRERRGG